MVRLASSSLDPSAFQLLMLLLPNPVIHVVEQLYKQLPILVAISCCYPLPLGPPLHINGPRPILGINIRTLGKQSSSRF